MVLQPFGRYTIVSFLQVHIITVVKCMKWKNECGKSPKLKDDNPSWLFNRTKKMLRDKNKYFNAIKNLIVVGVSNWIANEARESILKNK